MAFRGVSSWRFFAVQSQHHPRTRYYLLPYLLRSSISLFSTIDNQSNTSENHEIAMMTNYQCDIDEHVVLNELSDLFPAVAKNSEERIGVTKPLEELFLSPEDRLRGVFLQKLRGKTAIEKALSSVCVDLDVEVVSKVVNWGNLDGEKMVTFFNWSIQQPKIPKDVNNYHVILRALGRRKFLTHMVEILNDMRDERVTPNSETLSIAADALLRARRVSKAIQMFRNLGEIGLDCDTESLNALLKCLCRRSHVGAANSLLNSMKGKVPFDGATYNAVMKGWSRFGRVGKMENLLEAMVEDGVDPDGSTYSHLIEGLGRSGRVEDGVRIFDSMKERGLVPDTSCYNAMISNFVSVGNFDECMKYYNTMQSTNSDPNIDTYTRLIGGFLKSRKVADALEMFDEMLDRGFVPSTGMVTSFIEPLCGYGPPHAAMLVYEKAKRVGCKISSNAYKLLIRRLSRFGKCGILLNLWNEMEGSGYSSGVEVYEYVVEGLCNIGQIENAVLVMEECLRKGLCPSRLVCSKLNRKLFDSNKVERAYKLFLKIRDARRDENARTYWRSKGWHF